MIHVHHWHGLSFGDRRSHVEAWREGLTVGDVAGSAGHVLRNGSPCDRDDNAHDWDHIDVLPMLGEAVTFYTILASFAVSWAVQKLLAKPPPAKERGDERSSTYGYSRMKNIRVEGQPVPVVYGEHRMAGTIVNEFIEVDNTTGESTYFALVCVGHGPVTAIGGETVDTPALTPLEGDDVPSTIYINDNALANFSKVKVWVRLGSTEQDVIPGFDKAKTSNEVLTDLEQEDGGAGQSVIPIDEYGSDQYEAFWDEWGVAYDTATTEVDGLEVIVNFPQGLYTTEADTGQAIAADWMLAIRWCRLDSSGNAILGPGNGGNANDGWVREPIEQFNLRRQNPFQLSFPIWFYDPLDHVDPVAGDAWYSSSWTPNTNYFRTLDPVPVNGGGGGVPSDWKSNGYASQFSFEAWVAFDNAGSNPFKASNIDEGDFVALYEWTDSGSNDTGVFFGFELDKNVNGNRWIPYMRVGKWNRKHRWPEADIQVSPSVNEKVWHHILFSHKRIDSSTNRTDLWINGTWLGAQYGNTDIIVPGSDGSGTNNARMRFGYGNGIENAQFGIRGWWDQVVVWARNFGQAAAAARYNGGAGQVVNGANPDVVVLYTFDGGTFDDGSSYDNDGVESGSGGSFGSGDGVVGTKVSPERLRSRYRVQCMRANRDPNDGQDGPPHIDTAEWQFAITWLDEAFTHPGKALYGIQAGATEQLNTSAPDITAVVKGRPVLVWDGVNATNPSFTRQWTRNAIWCAVDAATDKTYGGGHIFQIENVHVESAKEAADVADRVVYDGRAQREFYRQEYESNANHVNSPEAFANSAWTAVSCSISSNDTTAPDGALSADTLTDSSAGARGYIKEASIPAPREPTWLAFSCFVAKDATATTHSGALYLAFGAGTPVVAIFNLDNGAAVQNCAVESYNDDWWLVKMDPFWSPGGSVGYPFLLDLRIYPSAYNYGTVTGNNNLIESMTVWGVMLNRGKTHLDYFTYNETPRAYLYLGDRDPSDVAQTFPSHWIDGYRLRLRSCEHTAWDTSTAGTDTLTIQETEVLDTHDGYRRSWRISCSWPSDVADPGSTFPQLVTGGSNWEDIAGDWTSSSGSTASVEYDDGGTTGGPTNVDPLLSDVAKVTAVSTSSPGLILQTLSASTGVAIRARALILKPSTLDAINFALNDSNNGKTGVNPTVDDEWETLEVDHTAGNAFPEVRFECYEDATDQGWVDGIGAYLQVDSSGYTPGGTVEGAEALFEYDAVHDTFKDIWDTIQDICTTARAVPIREGNRLRFKADFARDPVGLIGMGSTVLEGEDRSTFRTRYANKRQRSNSYAIDFADRDNLWDRATAEKHSDELDASASGDLRSENFFLQGVTRRSQVLRHAKYLLAQNELLTRDGSHSSSPGSVTFEPSDVVEIGHDLMPWGQSGRCSESSGATALNLIKTDFDSFDKWATTSGDVIVTADVMPNDVGDPDADKVETVSTTQVSLIKTVSGISNAKSYTFSVKVKAKVPAGATGILLTQSGGQTVLADFTWATATIAAVSAPSGINLTATALADGWYRLGVEIESKNQNDLSISILPARGGGDLSGKVIYLADAQLESGVDEPTSYQRPGVGIYADREITLDNGESYLCRVTSTSTGTSGTATVLASPGEYLPGDLIGLDVVALGFQPLRGDEYIIYTASERMRAQILSLGINEDGSVACEWVQHDDAVFAGDDLESNEVVESFSSNNGGRESNSSWGNTIPDDVIRVSAFDVPVTGPGGVMGAALTVGWVAANQQVPISEFRVYVAYAMSTEPFGPLEHIGTVPGGTYQLTAPLPSAASGSRIRVAVQPISINGARRRPADCGGAVIELTSRAAKPPAPTGFSAHMEGEQIVFTWTEPENSEGLTYEIRHGSLASMEGGWVLAQKVGVTTENRFGPTSWFATAASAGAEVTKINYMLRARNRHGVYSDVATIVYGARIQNVEVLTSSNYWYAYATQAWHEYGDGWKTDTGAPLWDPVLSNLTRHADGYLTFSSTKTATYVTASIPTGASPGHFEREAHMRIEAVVFAVCRNVKTVGEGNANGDGTFKRDSTPPREQVTYAWGGNEGAEGNLQEDVPTIRVQMKLIRDIRDTGVVEVSSAMDSGGSSGWIDYAPGVYQCHGAQFRIRLTRPTTDWDVRIYKFWTQTQRALEDRHYRTPAERVFAQELGLG